MLFFFVASGEKRIIKQTLLVLCELFFWKNVSFLTIWGKRWSLPPVLGYPWNVAYRYKLPMERSIPVQTTHGT